MNDLIRAGRVRTPEPVDKVGDIGIGVGNGSAPPVRTKPSNAQINEALRAATHRATRRLDLDGVDVFDVIA
jgi:hypothetical protein